MQCQISHSQSLIKILGRSRLIICQNMAKGRKAKSVKKEEPEVESNNNEEEEDETPTIPLDILLELPTKEKEMVPEFKSPTNEEGDIDLPALVARLKGLGYPLEGTFVYYWSNDLEVNVYCGYDPLPKYCHVP